MSSLLEAGVNRVGPQHVLLVTEMSTVRICKMFSIVDNIRLEQSWPLAYRVRSGALCGHREPHPITVSLGTACRTGHMQVPFQAPKHVNFSDYF